MRLFQEPSTKKCKAMDGFVHSIESFGTVDGPGIRYVVFMQGCPLRCAYCHNPDTWGIGKGQKMSVEEIIAGYNKNRSFYANGGITVTGGEPLVQVEFLVELFKKAKEDGIHTCIDTSGATYEPQNVSYVKKIDELMQYCDMVMLDIKHINDVKHKWLTGFDNSNILAFAKYLEKKKIPVWIRHVVVPGITDEKDSLIKLGEFVGSLKNVKALDVLPYHTMGEKKYESLGIPYRLSGVPQASEEEAVKAKKHILEGVNKARKELYNK